jgi:hypothetical protein
MGISGLASLPLTHLTPFRRFSSWRRIFFLAQALMDD